MQRLTQPTYHSISWLSPDCEEGLLPVSMDFKDMTLDELRAALAAELPSDAAFDGWTPTALRATAARMGVDPDVADLAFPDGAVQMVEAWFAHVDAQMAAALPTDHLAGLKIRARITALVEARLAVLAPHREALRRAQADWASGLSKSSNIGSRRFLRAKT